MINVLITGMGSTTAISVVKGLRQQKEIKLRIIGVDINNKNEIAGSYFCDAFYRVPWAIDSNYISELVKICKLENIHIIFPIVDSELEIIAANINLFCAINIKVWLSELKTIQICNDKYKTYNFLLKHQFCTPQTWLPEEVKGREEEMTYPLIVKPRNGFSSIDVFRVENAVDLLQTLKKVNQPLIQEYLSGTEFTIDVVTDDKSHILAVVPRERIQVKAGISYKGRTVKDEKLSEPAKEIAQALNINGHCNIQCRLQNNVPKFFEVNPRFSGTLPLTIAAGINSPLMLVKLAQGKNLDQSFFDFKENVYMARYWEEIFY
ncbi:carbamoyl phosphate synthase-like protein [Nostoc sp. 'Peltigera membranacea cyanobiont' N6]|nr:carbamoyl phosphate synthase-like protein [Nostoc sp. 'Peltigera membranacea cyanobiont' N6]